MDPLDNIFAFLQDDTLQKIKEDVVNANNVKNDSPATKKNELKKQTDGRLVSDKCDYKCDKQQALKYHNEAVHLKIKHFQCSECSYKSYQKRTDSTHIKLVHKGINSKIMKIDCNMCQTEEIHDACKTVISDVKKRKTRGNQTDGKYVCDKCEYTCNNNQSMRLHNDAVHLKIKKFKCSSCSFESCYKPAMQNHLKRKHKDENCKVIKMERKQQTKARGKYKCTECEFNSDFSTHLTMHKEAVHMKLKQFYCKICEFKSYFKHNTRSHMVNNHKNSISNFGKIGCEGCKASINFNDCFKCCKQKKKKNNFGKHKCPNCDYRSDFITNMKAHKNQKHLEIKRFYCKHCPFKSYYARFMRYHLKSKHSDESEVTRIGCKDCENDAPHENCGKLGKKERFICNSCTFRCNRRGRMKDHMRARHKITEGNIYRIGCELCKEGEVHTKLDAYVLSTSLITAFVKVTLLIRSLSNA